VNNNHPFPPFPHPVNPDTREVATSSTRGSKGRIHRLPDPRDLDDCKRLVVEVQERERLERESVPEAEKELERQKVRNTDTFIKPWTLYSLEISI